VTSSSGHGITVGLGRREPVGWPARDPGRYPRPDAATQVVNLQEANAILNTDHTNPLEARNNSNASDPGRMRDTAAITADQPWDEAAHDKVLQALYQVEVPEPVVLRGVANGLGSRDSA
jgi:hypothetical protein